MKSQDLKKYKIPDKPGVYFFYKGKNILYIGKATSLRDRVRSYFGRDLIATRGLLLVDMITQADKIKWQETDSVLEAIILEANLIKKYQPKYNTKEKDNKSFNYVCITNEELPKVLVVRGRNMHPYPASPLAKGEEKGGGVFRFVYGPFPNGLQLREAMKIIRRIFPYIDASSSKKQNYEFYKQLKLVPNINPSRPPLIKGGGIPLIRGNEGVKEYRNNIVNLNLFFQGKKKKIIQNFKKEMLSYAKNKEFEKAGEIKKRIFALEHINDVALIKEEDLIPRPLSQGGDAQRAEGVLTNSPLLNPPLVKGRRNFNFRIEAYDIAHMSGKNMVGVMTVVENNEPNKSEYKKFIIKTQKSSNDTGALLEVLSRRFRHTEWGIPNLMVVDGSTAQKNIAKRVLNRYQFNIPIVAVVKNDKHKAKAIIGDKRIIKKYKKSILLGNSEAHRFAIAFYRQKSRKNMLK
jgi:excinuclease ABC subunit C